MRCDRLTTMWVAVFALAIAGCRTDPPGQALEQTEGLSNDQVLAALAERANQVQRVMASGTIRLESDEDGSVLLDVALLASGDDQLRLRAWKLGRPVFDLTRDGDALWLWISERAEVDSTTTDGVPLAAIHIQTGWRMMAGRLFAQTPDRVISEDPFIVEFDLASDQTGGAPARAQFAIDRATQTHTRCTIIDSAGIERQTLQLGAYRLIDGIPWATSIDSGTDDHRFQITLESVELNGELPPSSFTPPSNAQRQP